MIAKHIVVRADKHGSINVGLTSVSFPTRTVCSGSWSINLGLSAVRVDGFVHLDSTFRAEW